MERSHELLLGGVLSALTVLPVVVGFVVDGILMTVAGLGVAGLVLPFAYKILRYPSLRHVSAGDIGRRVRRVRHLPVGGGMLVSFSGIDGSGKTTQGERLVESLEDDGISAIRVWGRWRPILTYPLMGVLYVMVGWRRKDYSRSRILRRVWAYLILIDQLAFTLWRIWPHLLRGRVVCVDRYLLDHFVELRFDGLYNRRAAALFRRFLPVPDITFVLDVPVERAMERKGDTGDMLDRLEVETEVEAYLTERRDMLLELGPRFDARIVDTTCSIQETSRVVHDYTLDAYWEP